MKSEDQLRSIDSRYEFTIQTVSRIAFVINHIGPLNKKQREYFEQELKYLITVREHLAS